MKESQQNLTRKVVLGVETGALRKARDLPSFSSTLLLKKVGTEAKLTLFVIAVILDIGLF